MGGALPAKTANPGSAEVSRVGCVLFLIMGAICVWSIVSWAGSWTPLYEASPFQTVWHFLILGFNAFLCLLPFRKVAELLFLSCVGNILNMLISYYVQTPLAGGFPFPFAPLFYIGISDRGWTEALLMLGLAIAAFGFSPEDKTG